MGRRSESAKGRDRKIFSRTWEGKSWKIIVSVLSYEGGQPKLQITREKLGRKYEQKPHAKLGRFTGEELAGILPLLEEALTHMKRR